MTERNGALDPAALVDDRPADGVFRIDRRIYTDAAVFEAEMAHIFEGSWVYACHESQIPKPGDYMAVTLGRQPVIVNRRLDGTLGGVVDACSHRGARLTPTRQGNARVLVCRYHGWSYAADGRCLRVKDPETGWERGFDLACFDLKRVPRVESYRGFVFASLAPDVPPLAEHLAEARVFIDMLADQSPDGLEVLPGSSTYAVDCNWKLQVENGVDGYHVGVVHRNFAQTVRRRNELSHAEGMRRTENARFSGEVPTGCYDLGNGHSLIWAERGAPEAAPLWEARDELAGRVGALRRDWMLGRGRNLLLFPNVFLMDQSSTQIRLVRPVSPSRTELTVWCIAPVGESAQARAARLAKFRDFFLMSGLATSDDAAALEDTQSGAHARLERWSPFGRGAHARIDGADAEAAALGVAPVASGPCWDHETIYLGQYRRWRRLMAGGAG